MILKNTKFPVSIDNGGTGGTTLKEVQEHLGFQNAQLRLNSSHQFNIDGNMGLLYAKRGSFYYIAIFTYWDSTPSVIASNGALPTITKNYNSNTFEVKNNIDASVVFSFISLATNFINA